MTTVEASKSRKRTFSSGGIRPAFRVRIELWLAVAFMALSFGAGIAVGVMAQPASSPVSNVGVAPAGQATIAPPLTQQQLEQGLPSGHPDISGISGGSQSGGTGSKGGQTGGSHKGSGSGSSQGSP